MRAPAFIRKFIGHTGGFAPGPAVRFNPRREILISHQRVTQFLKENGL